MKEKLFNNKLKRKRIIYILFLTIFLIGGTFIGVNLKNNDKQLEISEYEILDESVLTTDIMKRWVIENSSTKGSYTTSDNKYTYALISYGKTTTSNIGICLENVNFDRNIKIDYSIISNESSVETEEYSPKMILRFKGNDLKLNIKEVTPS